MKIRITFECDDDLRRAVAHHYGHEGEASYEDMKAWFRNYGEGCNADVLFDWGQTVKESAQQEGEE